MLKFTGERMLNHPESDLFVTTITRYEFAAEFFKKNYTVLDLACGSGYGSAYLATRSKEVVGMDIDTETIKFCKRTHKADNLIFDLIKPNQIIKKYKAKFDVIASFETIEHVKDYERFLDILDFYLKKEGLIIISTPNNYRKINPPENKFHAYEFDILELYNILKKRFKDCNVSLFGQQRTVHRRNKIIKDGILKILIKKILKSIYDFDKKTLNVFVKIEHLPIYKSIGRLQEDIAYDPSIYKINPKTNFYNPSKSIFLISRKAQ